MGGIMFQCDPLTTSDLVLIVLTIVALFGWWVQRKLLAPKLVASYEHKKPMARLSSRTSANQPTGWLVYDFHFFVENKGTSKAESVAAVVVEYWSASGSGKLIKRDDFLPVPLRYTTEDDKPVEFVDVHSGRPYYWNIGDIYPEEVQAAWPKEELYNEPGKKVEGLLFKLDLYKPPYYQTRAFPKGIYGIKVVLYSENAKPAEIFLKFEWTGEWKPNEEEMFEQIKIEQVHSFE